MASLDGLLEPRGIYAAGWMGGWMGGWEDRERERDRERQREIHSLLKF